MGKFAGEANIPGGVDIAIAGLQMVVDANTFLIIVFNARRLEIQTLDIGRAPGACKNFIDDDYGLFTFSQDAPMTSRRGGSFVRLKTVSLVR